MASELPLKCEIEDVTSQGLALEWLLRDRGRVGLARNWRIRGVGSQDQIRFALVRPSLLSMIVAGLDLAAKDHGMTVKGSKRPSSRLRPC